MARFQYGPRSSVNTIADRQMSLEEKKSDLGYQAGQAFLNEGLSAVARTLGALAVNAAEYEWFGGRTKDELAASEFVEQQKQNRIAEEQNARDFKYKLDTDIRNDTKARIDATQKLYGKTSPFLTAPQLQGAKFAVENYGKKKEKVVSTRTQEKDAAGRPTGQVKDVEVVEGVDPVAGFSPEARREYDRVTRDIEQFKKVLAKIEDPAEREQYLAQYLQSIGSNVGAAINIQPMVGKEGSSVTATETSFGVKAGFKPKDNAAINRARGDRQTEARNAASKFNTAKYYQRVLNDPNASQKDRGNAEQFFDQYLERPPGTPFNASGVPGVVATLEKTAKSTFSKARGLAEDPLNKGIAVPGKAAIGGEIAPAKEESKRQEELRRVFGEPAERDRALAEAAFRLHKQNWDQLSDAEKKKAERDQGLNKAQVQLLNGPLAAKLTSEQFAFGKQISGGSKGTGYEIDIVNEALRRAEFGGDTVQPPSKPAPKGDKYTRWHTTVKRDYKFGALDDSDLRKIFNRTAGADFADVTIGEIEEEVGKLAPAFPRKGKGGISETDAEMIRTTIDLYLRSKRKAPIFAAP